MTRIIAHRGASGGAPENTMSAFKKALDMGSHGIETDVQMTKDGVLILCHDETVERTTNGKGFIKDFTYSELRKLDAGIKFSEEFKGEKIPTLEELLQLLSGKEIILNLELKSGPIFYPDIEAKVLELLYKYNYTDNSVISSFNHYSLVELRKLDEDIRLGVLYMSGLYQPWKYAKDLGANAIHPYLYSLAPEIIKGAKLNNMPITVFTVDDPKMIRNFIKAGVEQIITNYPDVALQILSEER
ncbi:glycerophosphodiester phosphodiesterase [Alkalicella caledoniensis]|uniref:Glycerophosphodiester phosphodiesterase n=1 Tax=Alkalicella caledoniensis TaxID=2731377 RepID=A0A7G9WA83_ALKCA|nr:glycerophosphodiester phosphodiesterase [Alkalicella caledoniensis]QNO15595.1 glycerophosphodiester phosphodiesterase [Alkalicella caledoniensis]